MPLTSHLRMYCIICCTLKPVSTNLYSHLCARAHVHTHTVLENLDRERKDLPNEEAIYLVAPDENVSPSIVSVSQQELCDID